MRAPLATVDEFDPPFVVEAPPRQTAAVVFASPHSGAVYPPGFVAAARIDALTLRRSEDAFVDELFSIAPAQGAPLLKALFPRAYVDPNREPWELDPAMFADDLPDWVNTRSTRVHAGLGTIARVVANGAEIYRGKLLFPEARARIEQLYYPYHEALEGLMAQTAASFGHAVLIDCHSMPSVGGPMDRDPGKRRVDFVLGDCHGLSCHPRLTERVRAFLAAKGYAVGLNEPYAGGYCTRHYGRPAEGRHALQIEINRALYMDEAHITQSRNFPTLAAHMAELVGLIARVSTTELAPT